MIGYRALKFSTEKQFKEGRKWPQTMRDLDDFARTKTDEKKWSIASPNSWSEYRSYWWVDQNRQRLFTRFWMTNSAWRILYLLSIQFASPFRFACEDVLGTTHYSHVRLFTIIPFNPLLLLFISNGDIRAGGD